MDTKQILEKGVTFQDLIIMVREFSNSTDEEIGEQVFFDLTSESSKKILNVLLQYNYRLVRGKA
jgi:hypothetical protein